MIHSAGPVAIGMVVGWMLYYFMRLYVVFSPKTLCATLVALGGGPILNTLERISSGGEPNVSPWYFLGVGIGFFVYAVYAATVTIIFVHGRLIRTPAQYSVLLSCGATRDPNEYDLDVNAFYDFAEAVRLWKQEELTPDGFKAILKGLKFTRRDYLWSRYYHIFDIDVEDIIKFESEGYLDCLNPR